MKTPAGLAIAALMLGACAAAPPPSDQDQIEAWRPIIKGAQLHHVHLNVTDRKAAIAMAVAAARPEDVVLIAGKGHEAYQEVAGAFHSFSDLREAEAALAARKEAA